VRHRRPLLLPHVLATMASQAMLVVLLPTISTLPRWAAS